jgi:hypothetical protein
VPFALGLHPALAIVTQTAVDAVNVRMESQVAAPRVQDEREAELSSEPPFIFSELKQSPSCGSKPNFFRLNSNKYAFCDRIPSNRAARRSQAWARAEQNRSTFLERDR